MAVIVPLPIPLGLAVHQAALLFTFHVELEVTAKVVFPALTVTFLFGGETLSEGIPSA